MSFKFNMESRHYREKSAATAPSIAHLVGHGGIYKLMDADYVRARYRGHILPEGVTIEDIVTKAQGLFYHMADGHPFNIPTALVSHIASPMGGRTFSPLGQNNDNVKIPAFMTFVGQFIDHDLTQNLANLLDPQSGGNISDGASPGIDLDSVYSRSNALTNGTLEDIFDDDRKFILVEVCDDKGKLVGFDHDRDENDIAYIMDKRNEDNQMISQIHILIERLHNKLMNQKLEVARKDNKRSKLLKSIIKKIFIEVQEEVKRNWQSFIMHEYLPTVAGHENLNKVLEQFKQPGWGNLEHKPDENNVLNMPHEFAISFRMGHSMLRDRYHLRPGANPIDLFNSREPAPFAGDLAGSKPITHDHIIDWDFFSNFSVPSNLIDSKVTIKAFDLPVSTIPDADKQIVNLPQRNLIRSSNVNLAHAEHIIDIINEKLHEKDRIKKLTPDQIESDKDKQKLFRIDNDGNYAETNPFRTPLWYYILKEAEQQYGGAHLGDLGGRIISEVIAGGIYYLPDSFVYDQSWKSEITKTEKVSFRDIVEFVLGQ